MKNTMIHVCPNEPDYDFDAYTMIQRISAKAVDLQNEVIVAACIEAAKEAGVTDLYLLDKQFVAEAIQEKIEREMEKEDSHGQEAQAD